MDTDKFKMGWLLVAFDLPVLTKKERKLATQFRDFLIDDGFTMMQLSVYIRPCVSFARQETHMSRIKLALPPEGNVRGLFITRAQWERGFVFHGSASQDCNPEKLPEQLQFW
jgi:CRISPR-associated protein Cas2